MTYAQIYAESLRLMFAAGTDDFAATAEGMAGLIDNPNYRDYMLALPGAVNRCFADLEAKKVLHWKVARPDMSGADDVGDYKRLILSEVIPDCYEIERVVCHRGYGGKVILDAGEDYFIEGDELLLPKGEECAVHYTPVLPKITVETDLDGQVPLSPALAAVVPYYVKGELYRQEEPHDAAEAYNLYEQRVAQVCPPVGQMRGSVTMVYGFGGDDVW